MRISLRLPLAAVVLATLACGPAAEQPASNDVLGDSLGTVNFPVECNAEGASLMERGVALLHHMMYASARQTFQEAAEVGDDRGLPMLFMQAGISSVHIEGFPRQDDATDVEVDPRRPGAEP